MRKFALIAVVLATAVIAASASANPAPVGVKYTAQGLNGVLTIVDAQGLGYMAWASNGSVVAGGMVGSPYFVVPARNTGIGPDGMILRVRVGDVTFLIAGEDEHLIWE